MSKVIWLTPAGDLGIIPELVYYENQLDSYSTSGGDLTYKLVTGSLPAGLTISSTGLLSGIPSALSNIESYQFVVRSTNTNGNISDRTFSITVSGIQQPVLQPDSGSLGTFYAGKYFTPRDFTFYTDPEYPLPVVYSLQSGTLPPGLTLLPNGSLSGYFIPQQAPGSLHDIGFDGSPLDKYPFDYGGDINNHTYLFSIQVSDGNNIDVNDYYIEVQSPLPGSIDPIMITDAGSIGEIRQNTNFAFKFDAIDYEYDPITYAVTGGSLPSGLTLDPVTGWLTGLVPYGSLGAHTYNFVVQAYKTGNPLRISESKTFTIKVKGIISDTVNWSTDSNLGDIYNGDISTLKVQASTPSGLDLTYSLVSLGALPIGLKLLPDGTISGRASFQTVTDKDTYTFTIAASDVHNYAYSEKTFTISVVKRDAKPYENLYIQILPHREQRSIYNDIITNTSIFPTDYLYRPEDPWFGLNRLRRVLFMTGLNPDEVAQYISAMTFNHYWKTLNFNGIKTARALDNNLNPLYEVVYVELKDNQVNDQGNGPPLEVASGVYYNRVQTLDILSDSTSVPIDTSALTIDSTFSTYTGPITTEIELYVNSFPNMAERMGAGVGYENRGILPKWMTSRQENGTVLGFTRALVLAYVNPGRAKECAFRLAQNFVDFNLIDFTIDRYEWDSILSDNWIKGTEAGTGGISASNETAEIFGDTSNIAVSADNDLITSDDTLISADNTEISGSESAFTLELSPNAVIYVGNTVIGTVSAVVDNYQLNLTANSTITFFSEPFSYGNQFLLDGVEPGTGGITANTSSNILVGTSTIFGEELHLGDKIYADSTLIGVVQTITDNVHITLSNVSTSNIGGAQYSHTRRDPYTVPGQGDKYLKFPQVGVLN
jgi:Putative Ig domain